MFFNLFKKINYKRYFLYILNCFEKGDNYNIMSFLNPFDKKEYFNSIFFKENILIYFHSLNYNKFNFFFFFNQYYNYNYSYSLSN